MLVYLCFLPNFTHFTPLFGLFRGARQNYIVSLVSKTNFFLKILVQYLPKPGEWGGLLFPNLS